MVQQTDMAKHKDMVKHTDMVQQVNVPTRSKEKTINVDFSKWLADFTVENEIGQPEPLRFTDQRLNVDFVGTELKRKSFAAWKTYPTIYKALILILN